MDMIWLIQSTIIGFTTQTEQLRQIAVQYELAKRVAAERTEDKENKSYW